MGARQRLQSVLFRGPCGAALRRAVGPVEVRALRDEDLPALERALAPYPDENYPDDLRRQARGELTVLLATSRAGILGLGVVAWAGPRAKWGLASRAGLPEIHRVRVRPWLRCLGIGAQLLTGLEQIAARRGCPAVGLCVHCRNEGAARLYQRRGYVDAGLSLLDVWTEAVGPGASPVSVEQPTRLMTRSLRPLDR